MVAETRKCPYSSIEVGPVVRKWNSENKDKSVAELGRSEEASSP